MASKWAAKLRPLLSSAMEGQGRYSARRLLTTASAPSPILPTSISKLASFLPPLPGSCRIPGFSCGFSPYSPFTMIQKRDASSKERKRTRGTPVTSKLKKIKMKSYSSYKFRFRTMNDGKIRRWREGKRHNAHLKDI